MRIASALSACGLVSEATVGFVKGDPTIGDAFGKLAAPKIIFYALFASNGYFTRDRAVQLLDEANNLDREVRVLPPLGLDPGLPDFLLGHAFAAARANGFGTDVTTILLLAHGSRRNPASRAATEQVARALEQRNVFRSVDVALLEESPSLHEAAGRVRGPIIVIGLFSGEGMHGAEDTPRLIGELNRDDVIFAGAIGSARGIEGLVAAALRRAVHDESISVESCAGL